MLRIALGLMVLALVFEFGRTQIYEQMDYEPVTALVDHVETSCVLQRKLTSGLVTSDPMPCIKAQAEANRASGWAGLQLAHVAIIRFSFRSPADQRQHTGIHRTKPAAAPLTVGRSVEIRASKKDPSRYRVPFL